MAVEFLKRGHQGKRPKLGDWCLVGAEGCNVNCTYSKIGNADFNL